MRGVHLWGNSITERQARLILPILVRQAMAKQPIFYGQISDELGIGHSYLGDHLGIIADALNALAKDWGEEIPPIQGLVFEKTTKRPGKNSVTARAAMWAMKQCPPNSKQERFVMHSKKYSAIPSGQPSFRRSG